jgi:hypothetical protein
MTLKATYLIDVNLDDMMRKISGTEAQMGPQAFQQIPQKLARKYLKAASRDGARLMYKALKSATPRREGKGKGQGNLQRSIKTGAKFWQRGAEAGAVGVIFYSRKNNLGNHSWLLESGTKDRFVTTRKGKKLSKPAFRGKGPAKHMMRDTRSFYATQVHQLVQKRSIEGLENAIRDMAKPRY